jgi:hypothetical protein
MLATALITFELFMLHSSVVLYSCLNFNLRTAIYAGLPLIYSLSASIDNFMNFMATDLKSVCSKKSLIFAYFLISFNGFYLWINNSSLSSGLSSHKLLDTSTNVTDTIVKTLVNSHAHWITVKQRPLSSSSQKPVSAWMPFSTLCLLLIIYSDQFIRRRSNQSRARWFA